MNDHTFDRWTTVVAHRRRLLTGGLLGGLLARLVGVRNSSATTTRRTLARQDCSLGCTTSTCGEIPEGCPLFPPDNIWNTLIDGLPVDGQSDAYVASIGPDTGLHPDFGSGLLI